MKRVLLTVALVLTVATQSVLAKNQGLIGGKGGLQSLASRQAAKRRACHRAGLNYYVTPGSVGQCIKGGLVGASNPSSRKGFVGGVY